ncbi:related to D-mandelate dehydrogenase [Cephalotrichum gorgonifer]|uniref:Related to D-mandelate dehydrogenase n=1 Tax=Cephalotrichum gorgonifer TaxID=2041049 RepID=A0AAE8SUI1_9PEZI|nr:related to D-mandelate dehydrogenase [Cephalotrichum gorgonifer]
MTSSKPVVLHLGDPVEFNLDLYKELESKFVVIHPSLEERQRPAFLQALRDQKWGSFSGVFRPFWNTGGEMGRWDSELVPLLPESMTVYASAGAGYDWADVDLFAERGILYCNGASASSEAVADMAIYHILSVFRNLQWSNMAARTGDAEQFLEAHRGQPVGAHNPKGHTLGIIGLGNIGYRIATKAYRGFDMKIIYNDLFPKSAEQEAELGGARRIADLDELLASSDCVVVSTTGGGGKKLLDAERISKMKKGSRLVNIARGTLIDENALADALESGHIHAVGLDVHEEEPRVNSRLVKNRNATLTCHNAGGAFETTSGFEELAMRNVLAVLSGLQPLTPVNKHLMKN